MTQFQGVFPVMCPGGVAGAGLAPACWPDQKPVRPCWGVTRHSRVARGFHPQTGYRVCPPTLGWRSIRMVADQLDYVVGVDPHRDRHALGVVEVRSGVVVFEACVAADSGGYADALAVAVQHAPGRRAFAVEGSGSYGAGLARFLSGSGEQVFEVGRLPRERRGGGKTDALDAVRAARSVLAQERPAMPRTSGEREALRALMAAREGAAAAKRAGLCQLRALLITAPEPVRAELRSLTRARLLACLTAMRPERRTDPELRGSLLALRSLARRVQQLTVEERELAREIKTLTQTLAPQLLDQPGVGPLLAAQVVLSWSHQGRLTSEAAFARLAGVAPIPASSGQTIRYRLDRSGDRQLNRALHMIIVTRRRAHPATIAYIERRIGEGKTRREATRCLKRYLARNLYRILENGAPPPS
jgi:transposase